VDLKQLNDPALLMLVAQRDERALSELYDRYGRLVFSVAYTVIGDRQSAEEITLDVFMRVWEKVHTYRPDQAKVSTWVTRITRNRAIDALRREEVRPLKHSIGWADVSPEPAAESKNPEIETHLALQQRQVREAMATLPEEQREVLALAYFKGYTHREIAQLLDQPLGTVKGRIRAGMKKLRLLLQDDLPNLTSE
jgi:RNA polymerase sigma-70 factor (ECF subfamily)